MRKLDNMAFEATVSPPSAFSFLPPFFLSLSPSFSGSLPFSLSPSSYLLA